MRSLYYQYKTSAIKQKDLSNLITGPPEATYRACRGIASGKYKVRPSNGLSRSEESHYIGNRLFPIHTFYSRVHHLETVACAKSHSSLPMRFEYLKSQEMPRTMLLILTPPPIRGTPCSCSPNPSGAIIIYRLSAFSHKTPSS